MNNFGGWLRQAGMNMLNGMRRFMAGRYGHDRLNITLLVVGCVLCFVQLFVPSGVGVVLTILSEALLILSLPYLSPSEKGRLRIRNGKD